MTTPHEHMSGSDVAAGTERRKPRIPTCANPIWQGAIRQPAVAGTFYPADPDALRGIIDRQLDYARTLLDHHNNLLSRLPQGAPKAVIAPHAGYVYSGTTEPLPCKTRGCSDPVRAHSQTVYAHGGPGVTSLSNYSNYLHSRPPLRHQFGYAYQLVTPNCFLV